jgi:hypothetical protein
VNFILIQRIFHLIRKDASRQARDKLFRLVGIRGMQNVIVDKDIFSEECKLYKDAMS